MKLNNFHGSTVTNEYANQIKCGFISIWPEWVHLSVNWFDFRITKQIRARSNGWKCTNIKTSIYRYETISVDHSIWFEHWAIEPLYSHPDACHASNSISDSIVFGPVLISKCVNAVDMMPITQSTRQCWCCRSAVLVMSVCASESRAGPVRCQSIFNDGTNVSNWMENISSVLPAAVTECRTSWPSKNLFTI